MNDQFKRDFAKILQRAGDKANTVVRASAVRLGASMVQKSPVDTGRFKGNWVYGTNTANLSIAGAPDKGGQYSIARFVTGTQAWKAGETMYMTNSLPYAKRLEYGWSKQAPSGMVRLTVMEWKQYIAAEAAKVRNA